METLHALNRIKVLDSIYFGGGTMLRLCHNMNRYSTDLDFWMKSESNTALIFEKMNSEFADSFVIKDATEKLNTLIFEIRSEKSQRSLVVEIRKGQSQFQWERKIAFSPHSTIQVMVKALTLQQMMHNKVNALLDRQLIRDAFDIEFILRRGIEMDLSKDKLKRMLRLVDNFSDRDFKVSLGSLLEAKERMYYVQNRFQFLCEEIRHRLHELDNQGESDF